MEHSRLPKADIKAMVLHILQSEGFGKTPYQLAKQLNISRQTINKYLQELEDEKKIRNHEVGPYKIYMIVRPSDKALYKKLYLFLLSVFDKFRESNPTLLDSFFSQVQLNRHEFVENLEIPVPVKIPELNKQDKTHNNLLTLLEGVRYLIDYFMPFQNPPKIEMVPVYDRITPLSIELRVEDPGLLSRDAVLHYYIIASLIQEQISLLSKESIYFRVSKPIEDQTNYIFFELGYVDKYFQDFSVSEYDNEKTNERELLDEIKEFFSSQINFNIDEYTENDKLHYKLIFADNINLETLYELYIHTAEENTKIAKQLQKEIPDLLIRKWIPYEKWNDSPFAVIDCTSNFGFLIDEYVRASHEADKFGGICVHFEKIENGWRINCLDRIDFDQLFAPLTDWEKRHKIYAKLSNDPDEFLRRRMIVIAKLKQEHDKKRSGVTMDL